jgi:hypothetical protein
VQPSTAGSTPPPAAPQPPPAPGGAVARVTRALRAARARQSFEAFCEFTQRDESSGQPISLAPMHREWIALLESRDRLQLLCHVEAGKSALVSVAWVLWTLGKNPAARCCIVSNTAAQSEKLLRSVARQIERNEELRATFPHLRPAQPWNQNAITIIRPGISKDPSCIALGLHGALLGSRLDLLVVDDAHDFENSRTEEQRDTAFSWLQSTGFSRLTHRAQVVVIGTPWHPQDIHGRLEALAGRWHTARYPIERDDGSPQWSARWSPERIHAKRAELGVHQAARQLDVICAGDEASTIHGDWVALALRRGATESLRLSLNNRGEPFWVTRAKWPARVLCGLDPSVGNSSKSDLSALVTVYVHADGTREIIEVQSGRWSGPQILQRVDSAFERFGPARLVLESNGSQAFLEHFARERGARWPLETWTTGRGERSLQWLAERFGAELAGGRWIFPSIGGAPATPELQKLVNDLHVYSPRDHVPDRLAALLLATTAIKTSGERVENVPTPISLAR